MTPIRIQRKRTKGWKMPNNTIYVGRPSRWGNPFKKVGDIIYLDAGYRRKILDKWIYVSSEKENDLLLLYEMLITDKIKTCTLTVSAFGDVMHWLRHFRKLNLSELKNKNLACWCKPDEPCHADVLLRLANI